VPGQRFVFSEDHFSGSLPAFSFEIAKLTLYDIFLGIAGPDARERNDIEVKYQWELKS
jgi:hypothetical protein